MLLNLTLMLASQRGEANGHSGCWVQCPTDLTPFNFRMPESLCMSACWVPLAPSLTMLHVATRTSGRLGSSLEACIDMGNCWRWSKGHGQRRNSQPALVYIAIGHAALRLAGQAALLGAEKAPAALYYPSIAKTGCLVRIAEARVQAHSLAQACFAQDCCGVCSPRRARCFWSAAHHRAFGSRARSPPSRPPAAAWSRRRSRCVHYGRPYLAHTYYRRPANPPANLLIAHCVHLRPALHRKV